MTVRMRRLSFLLIAGLMAGGLVIGSPSSEARDGRCETARPEREPTHTWGGGLTWADEEGVAHSGPDDDPNMYGHVDLREGAVQGRGQADNTLQAYVSPERQCLVVGAWEVGGTGAWEFEGTEAVDEPVPLPPLRRQGRFWVAPDGRRTILYGVDTLYSVPGVGGKSFHFIEEDFDRIRSWGMNVLRIRLQDQRAGYFPSLPDPEPGYLERLDEMIAQANRRGIYVIIATGGVETQFFAHHRRGDVGHDQLKFIEGTPAHDHWIGYLGSIFDRYQDWPGVVGFDGINEDYGYPPGVHDRFFMEAGHRAALARLRDVNDRAVYFQQPSGWDYWGRMPVVGHDLGDGNRNYCTKWSVNGPTGGEARNPEGNMQDMLQHAQDAGTPLFVCEYVIYRDSAPEEQQLQTQREVIALLDANLVGSNRNLYADVQNNALLDEGRQESFWIRELVRPYPAWVGGEPTALTWDFDARRLDLSLDLDGTGATEVFVSPTRTYPDGFVVTTTSGAHLLHDGDGVVSATGLAWDPDSERIVLPSWTGLLSLTIEPREP